MADISENRIKEDINEILKGADLTQLSSKKIRKQLEEKYGVDLTERKKEIDGVVLEAMEALEEQENEDEGEKSDLDHADKELSDSSESDLEAPEDMGPPVKKQKVKKKEVSNESDDEEEDDAEIARRLQEEENQHGRRTRAVKKTPSKKPMKSSNNTGKKRSGPGTYGKECMLSPALASVMGVDRMKRSEVVKRMWEVVRERELQDPKNKSFMLCDDELYKVFGRKRVKTFGMMKYLTDHIYTPEEYRHYFGVDV